MSIVSPLVLSLDSEIQLQLLAREYCPDLGGAALADLLDVSPSLSYDNTFLSVSFHYDGAALTQMELVCSLCSISSTVT